VGDENGRLIGVGRAGSCRDAGSLRDALREAGVEGIEFESACFGLSGGGEGGGRELVLAQQYVFTHDADVALMGAGADVIVIAGTGSMAFGRDREGRTARAGGWGFEFGDEGSAFDLVREALRAALRFEEGWGTDTALRGMFPDGAHEAMHRYYGGGISKAEMAGMAPMIDDAAAAGDHAAGEILRSGAQQLATLVGIVRGQLVGASTVSYHGGVFKSAVVLERFRMLVEMKEGTKVIAPRYGPAAGALLMAYRAAGVTCLLENVPEEKGVS
jgi:N-acetylglucosamine kinase-like BadF-type ATPase